MVFAVPQYEVRYFGATEWEEISEIKLMQKLIAYYDRVSPLIQKMIEGEQVITPDAVYRLKRRERFQYFQ